jgi:hypothetical protein
MESNEPCDACKAQVEKRLHDSPHEHLSLVWSKERRRAMTGGHGEYVYQCADCGSLIFHMHDKNDVMPFWHFTNEIPQY